MEQSSQFGTMSQSQIYASMSNQAGGGGVNASSNTGQTNTNMNPNSTNTNANSSTNTNTAAAAGQPQALQLLGLKVIRLSRPLLAEKAPLYIEEHDLAWKPGNGSKDMSSVFSAEESLTFRLGEQLQLPSDFGYIYLGETFAPCICINNESTQIVKFVCCKVELQTATTRITLYDSTEKPKDEMKPGDIIEYALVHEIKELGGHILVCNVNYDTSNGEKKYFRKFFKFQVLNPLAVKTKIYTVKSHIYLEAQVQNTTNRSIYLDTVRFDPSQSFNFTDLNQFSEPSTDFTNSNYVVNSCDPVPFLMPQDIRQFLYQLKPKTQADKQVNVIGKLDITWRTTMGERGRLQTSQLTRKISPQSEVELEVIKLPNTITLEIPFTALFRVKNCTSQALNLTIFTNKLKMVGIITLGPTQIRIGDIKPEESKEFSLQVLPIHPGFVKIGGIGVSDVISQFKLEFDNLAEIFVVRG